MKTKSRPCRGRHVKMAVSMLSMDDANGDGVLLYLAWKMAQDIMTPVQWQHFREQVEAARVEAFALAEEMAEAGASRSDFRFENL